MAIRITIPSSAMCSSQLIRSTSGGKLRVVRQILDLAPKIIPLPAKGHDLNFLLTKFILEKSDFKGLRRDQRNRGSGLRFEALYYQAGEFWGSVPHNH
jgi:hypothetical protein